MQSRIFYTSMLRYELWRYDLFVGVFFDVMALMNQLLQRDNHPDDEDALKNAQNQKTALNSKLRDLKRLQGSVKDWWQAIGVQREVIQKKKKELIDAR